MSGPGLGKTIFSAEEIHQRVADIAAVINRDYQDQELVVIGVLKGSIYFLVDLTRHLTMPIQVDFLSIGISLDETKKGTVLRINKDIDLDLTGRHVLLVEDVIGTGLTLGYICHHLDSAKPASLKICTLLDKPGERLLPIHIDYQGFTSDLFLVGYGLDYNDQYRNLPYLAEFRLR